MELCAERLAAHLQMARAVADGSYVEVELMDSADTVNYSPDLDPAFWYGSFVYFPRHHPVGNTSSRQRSCWVRRRSTRKT